MKETTAGIIFFTIWILIMLIWMSPNEIPNMTNYERNETLGNPCDFMSSGQYSVNC